MALPNGAGGYQLGDGNLNELTIGYAAAPQTATSTATLTAAQVTGGFLVANPSTSAATYTLPTASAIDAVVTSAKAGSTFTLNVVNTGTSSGTVTLATVNALAGNSKTITMLGSANSQYAQNLVYHKDAITFATADLLLPQGVDMAARAVHNGISLRVVRQYDINNDRMPCRIDVLYGYSAIRPQMACRIWG